MIRMRHLKAPLLMAALLGGLTSGCRLFHGPPDTDPLAPRAGVEVSYEWLSPAELADAATPNALGFVVAERHTNNYGRVSGFRLSSTNAVLEVDPSFEPQLGTYHYKVSWRGIGVGDAEVILGKEGDMHTIEMRAGTGRKLDMLYKVRYRGKAIMESDSFKSVEAHMVARVKDRQRHTRLDFQEDGDVDFTLTKSKDGEDREKIETATVETVGFALDPLSAACLVRRLDWEVGKDAVFEVVTGKSHYEMHLTCTRSERVKVNGKKRRAWVIVPVLRKLDTDDEGKRKEHEDNVNKSSIKIYVAQDESKDVLKIVGHHKVGNIKAQMEKFRPAPAPEPVAPPAATVAPGDDEPATEAS